MGVTISVKYWCQVDILRVEFVATIMSAVVEAIFLMFGVRDYVPTRRMFMLQDLSQNRLKREI